MQGSEAIHPDKMGPVIIHEAWEGIGSFIEMTRENQTFTCKTDKGTAVITFLTDEMFRVKLFMREEPNLKTTIAIEKRERVPVTLEFEDRGEVILFTTNALQVELDKQSFYITVRDLNGQWIAQQQMVSFNPRGEVNAIFDMPEDSHFYGLGEKSSFLDKRGERYTNWNTDVYAPHMPEIEALYESIPFLIHMHEGNCYGLFLDNPGRTDADMRSHSTAFSMGCSTGHYDMYFITGPQMKDVVKRYTSLTGRVALPPKWAIGYHQSRYSYMNQQEVMELARTFREKAIPCDVIYLDIHYMDEYRVFTFDPVRFPDPEGMMRELREMGIRIIPIVDPGVNKDPKYPIYKEGVQDNHFSKKLEGEIFLGEVWPGISAFPDFSEDRTSEWWGDHHAFYTNLGIEGIWNDMNEPAVFNESKTMDLDVVHGNNGDPATHEEIHNLYGLLMSKATYEGMKRHMDGQRPFVLTRAGYSGIQRYAAVWTGDNRSFWEHMAMAMPMVLNMGLSGLPFSGPDIGGFAHHTSAQLLVRWTQMGVFFPYCRNHSSIDTMRQEPWSFGEEVEDILRTYIGLRYRWMPHMYNLFQESSISGLPIVRPLILEYPQDANVTNLCDQFLFGDNVLIAPVYRPDTDHRAVYLPEGTWIDYWSGESHDGGRYILAHAPLQILPIYVKAGAILAEGPLKQYAEDGEDEHITFYSYGARADSAYTASYTFYEDDGVSFDYEKGQSSRLNVTVSGQENGIQLSYAYNEHAYTAKRNRIEFIFKSVAFIPAEVSGLQQITVQELDEGGEGWSFLEDGSLRMVVSDCEEGDTFIIKK